MANTMEIDNTLKATLLLCCHFNKDEVREFKPLTPLMYGRFAKWLNENKFNPADLFTRRDEILSQWVDPSSTHKVDSDRIEHLFSRGRSMAIALEKWQRAGIWVISRANPAYPKCFKEKLKQISPPFLFGIGNQSLLNSSSIGFVGSRSISSDDEKFTQEKVKLAIEQGFNIVSGGAKGIDQISMLVALNAGGSSIGILADSLLKAALSRVYRSHITNKKLVLVSPFYPEAGFVVGNAMARNKYIYCASQAVVVVKTDFGSGGTWTGAKENIKQGWVPTLVRDRSEKGHKELIKLGATAISDSFDDFTQQLSAPSMKSASEQPITGTLDFGFVDDGFESTAKLNSSINTDALLTTRSSITNTYANKDEIDCSKLNEMKPVQKETLTSITVNDRNQLEPEIIKDVNVAEKVNIKEKNVKAEQPAEHGHQFLQKHRLLNLFYSDIQEICHQNNEVVLKQLSDMYPELSSRVITKWLKLLTENSLLEKIGSKHIYRLSKLERK